MRTRATYASHAKTPSIKSIPTQNAQSVSDNIWHSQSHYFICYSCLRTRTQLAITKNKKQLMKTKLAAGIAPTCLKNAQFAKLDCTVIKNEYLPNIDHPVHKGEHTVCCTRIHQLENLTTKNGHLSLFYVHSFVPYYFQIFYFYPW